MAQLLEDRKWKLQKLLMFIQFSSTPLLAIYIFARWYRISAQLQGVDIGSSGFSIALNLMGLFICSLLFLSSVKDRRDRTVRTACFSYLIALIDYAMFFEIWNICLNGNPNARILQTVVDTIYLGSVPVVCCVYWMYLVQIVDSDDARLQKISKFIFVWMILVFLGTVGNIFGHYFFYVDESGVYRTGSLAAMAFVFPAMMMLLFVVFILNMKVSASNKRVLISFVTMTLTGVAVEALTDFSTSYPAMLCSMIFIYGNVFKQKETELVEEKLSVMQAENKLMKAKEKETAIETELTVASQIQNSILPNRFPPFPNRDEFELYARMRTAKDVGGDFYDFFMIDDTHLGLVIADVSGKGIAAALFMMVSRSMIKNAALQGLSPAETLDFVNNQLCEGNKADMFVTVWLGVLDVTTGELTASSAGHEYPVLTQREGEFEFVRDKHGLVLAVMEDTKHKNYTMQIEPGSTLFVYTDGVIEAQDDIEDQFGEKRLLKALNESAGGTPEEIINHVDESIKDFVGYAEQFDDITMLAVRLKKK